MTIDPTLRDSVLSHVAKGDQQRRTMEFLIRVYGIQDRVPACDIAQNAGIEEANVPPVMSRLRDQLPDFFDFHPLGRTHPQRIVLVNGDPGSYALTAEPNHPPTDLVGKFWNRHTGPRVTVLYPEVPSFQDAKGMSLWHPSLTSADMADRLADLGVRCTVMPSSGFVAAPLTRSVFGLSDCFATWDVPVVAKGVPPTMDRLDTDAIVLGTPGSLPLLVRNVEAVAPMQTTMEGVRVRLEGKEVKVAERWFRDTPEFPGTKDGSELKKYAVVTRHHYRFQRTITGLVANDPLAVEALIPFLANEETLLTLARMLGCRENFPDHFQALVCLHVFKGHPFARQTEVVRAIDLTKPPTGRSQREAIDAVDEDDADND